MLNKDRIRRVAVIMAGGSGERFWPLSRQTRPKQLLRLTSTDVSMLEEAVQRIAPLIPPEHVFIVTGRHLVAPIREAGVGVPDDNIIAEPCKRNTAGALVFAAAYVLFRYAMPPDALSMAVLSADHRVGDAQRFRDTIDSALTVAETEPVIGTIGMTPNRPETGYGYIQVERDAAPLLGSKQGFPVLPVAAFHEKPKAARAADFLSSGDYLWNGGMFFWRLSTFLDELRAARPAMADAVTALAEAMRQGGDAKVDALFAGLEDISIDYALMEHARRVVVAQADFPWDDIGAWPAINRSLDHDTHGNVAVGEPVVIDSRDTIVYNASDLAVGVVGLEGIVVVVTDDAVLVMPKDRAQDVREIVKALKERGDPRV